MATHSFSRHPPPRHHDMIKLCTFSLVWCDELPHRMLRMYRISAPGKQTHRTDQDVVPTPRVGFRVRVRYTSMRLIRRSDAVFRRTATPYSLLILQSHVLTFLPYASTPIRQHPSVAGSPHVVPVRCRCGWKRWRRLVQSWQWSLDHHGQWRLPTRRLRERSTGWLYLAEVRTRPRVTRLDVYRRATSPVTDHYPPWWRHRTAQSLFRQSFYIG